MAAFSLSLIFCGFSLLFLGVDLVLFSLLGIFWHFFAFSCRKFSAIDLLKFALPHSLYSVLNSGLMCVRRNCFPFSALPYPLIFSISVSICCILNNFFICLLVHKFSLELLITCLTHPLIFFFKFLESCFAFQSYLIKLAALTPTLFYFCKHFQHAYFSSSDKHLMSLEA